eukprot:1561384-Prymnesium_polylepis.2
MGTEMFAGCGVTRVRTAINSRASRMMLPRVRGSSWSTRRFDTSAGTRAPSESGETIFLRKHNEQAKLLGAAGAPQD